VWRSDRGTCLWHTGSLDGFAALLSLLPDEGRALVLGCNSMGYEKLANVDMQLFSASETSRDQP
jgi:hypothetical protein